MAEQTGKSGVAAGIVVPDPRDAIAQEQAPAQTGPHPQTTQGDILPASAADRIRSLDKVFKNEDFRALVASQMEELERASERSAARAERLDAEVREVRAQREELRVQNGRLTERLEIARTQSSSSRLISGIVGVLVAAAFFVMQASMWTLGWLMGLAALLLLGLDFALGLRTERRSLVPPRPDKSLPKSGDES